MAQPEVLDSVVYETCVIGSGLFGSSSAKYAAEDGSTILMGPSEEASLKTQVFGAWHDEGSITCPWFETFAWSNVTKESLNRFRSIESESGIEFFSEVGFLTVGSSSASNQKDLEEKEALAEAIKSEGSETRKVDKDYAAATFPYLNLPTDLYGYHNPKDSGYLSPRNLVAAQQLLARRLGCVVVDGVVADVAGNADEGFKVAVTPSDGSGSSIVLAKKLILAPGAYVNINSWMSALTPEDKKDQEPDLSLKCQTVAYLEVEAAEAESLKSMPSMGTSYEWGPIDGTYILPPILYPDGKYYLKLGHHDHFESTLPDHPDERVSEIRNWYGSLEGNPEAVAALSGFITESLIPDLKVASVHGGCCVTSNTKNKTAPYIDTLIDGVTLVCGGTGYGAKCSDEIGRIGAKLSTSNEWTSVIPSSECRIEWSQI